MKTAALVAALVAAASVSAAKITEYPLGASSTPYTIALGPDGNVWFTEWGLNKIGRITNAGAITEYPPSELNCNPYGITAGENGHLYYTCTTSGSIEEMLPSGPVINVLAAGSPTGQLAVGPDGNFWYGAGTAGAHRIQDDGTVLTTYLGSAPSSGRVSGVARGPIGSAWFLDWESSTIWLFKADGSGDVRVSSAGITQDSFVVQCHGFGWATMTAADSVHAVSQSHLSFLQLSKALPAGSAPTGVACGPDGTVWVALRGTNKIGRIANDPYLTYTDFPVPTPNAGLWGVAVGADGSVWFAESAANKIGRLQLRPAGDVNGDGNVDVSDVFYLINFLFAGGAAPVP